MVQGGISRRVELCAVADTTSWVIRYRYSGLLLCEVFRLYDPTAVFVLIINILTRVLETAPTADPACDGTVRRCNRS